MKKKIIISLAVVVIIVVCCNLLHFLEIDIGNIFTIISAL